jgi:hypothetical protein
VAQTVEVVAILVAAADGEGARRDQLDHLVPDAALVAQIGHGVGEPRTHAEPPLRLAQQEQTAVGGLIAALEINCELLALDGWQVERQRRIVNHGGCGVAVIREHLVSTPICYAILATCATVASTSLMPGA